MRAQPLHIGHQKIIEKMFQDCEHITLVLGSIQEQGTERNPFDYPTRRKMFENVYAGRPEYSRMQILGLADINNPVEWSRFVIASLRHNFPSLPYPDVYYAGSEYDLHWFKNCIKNIELVDRNDPDFPFVSGTMVREMIRLGDARWKNFVAAENHELITTAFHRLQNPDFCTDNPQKGV